MVDRGLGRTVREGVEHRRAAAIHGADVDHAGRRPGGGGGAQRGQQRLGEEERTLYIGVHDLVPARFRELPELRTPRGTGVVDEHIEPGFAGGERRGEGGDTLERGEVSGQGGAFAAVRRDEALCCGMAGLGFARADVDLGATGQKASRHHLADAARAAGDEHGLAGDGEQILHRAGSAGRGTCRPSSNFAMALRWTSSGPSARRSVRWLAQA